MLNYRVASKEDVNFFEGELEKYNLKQKPLQQEKEFLTFKHVAEENGKVVGVYLHALPIIKLAILIHYGLARTIVVKVLELNCCPKQRVI
ncbi:MAG: hypothetical protein JJU16_03015 [Alkalibacterium sp.]|nr:hypothetical protein [Alkalibacterium sp.]